MSPTTGCTLIGGHIVIDTYGDYIRFFEGGGTHRGCKINISDMRSEVWSAVCTTNVADVKKTSITSNNTDLYTIGQAYYCIKNGICYINFWPITVKKTGSSIKTGKIFQKPLLVRASGTLIDGNGNLGGQAYIGESGELRFDCSLANTELYCTISYPVENS